MSVSVLTGLARQRVAAWLGIVGIGLQAALPLFLALALMTAPCGEAGAASGVSAIHPDHLGHHDKLPAPHRHAPTHCTLCQVGTGIAAATLPGLVTLHRAGEAQLVGFGIRADRLIVRGSPAAYTSRAPPSDI